MYTFKLVLTGIILLVIATIICVFFTADDFYIPRIAVCKIRGGKMFNTYYNSYCEIKSKDSGKKCFYNEECEKRQCLYHGPSDCNFNGCLFPEELEMYGGNCSPYNIVLDSKDCTRKKGEHVRCYIWPERGR